MVWPALPWRDPRIKATAQDIVVKGVPLLLITKRDGTILSKNAVKGITDGGPEFILELLESSNS